MSQFILPARATDANNNPLSGALLYFYFEGTTTPADVYSDADRSTAHPNPVVANSGGLFAPIYLSPDISYRAILKTSGGVTLDEYDPYTQNDTITSSVANFGAVGGGVVDDTAALQRALNSGRVTALKAGETYLITSGLNHVPGAGFICFDGTATIKAKTGAGGFNVKTSSAPRDGLDRNMLRCNVTDDLILRNVHFTTDNATEVVLHGVRMFGGMGGAGYDIQNVSFSRFFNGAMIALGSTGSGRKRNIHIDSATDSGTSQGSSYWTGGAQTTVLEIDNDIIAATPSVPGIVKIDLIRDVLFTGTAKTDFGQETDGVNIVCQGLSSTSGWDIDIGLIDRIGEGVDIQGFRNNIRIGAANNVDKFVVKVIHGAQYNNISVGTVTASGIAVVSLSGSTSPVAATDTRGNVINIGSVVNHGTYGSGLTTAPGDCPVVQIANTNSTWKPVKNVVHVDYILGDGVNMDHIVKDGGVAASLDNLVTVGRASGWAVSTISGPEGNVRLRYMGTCLTEMTMSADQTLASGTAAKIAYDTVAVDTESLAVTASNKITIKWPGVYRVQATARMNAWAVGVTDQWRLDLYRGTVIAKTAKGRIQYSAKDEQAILSNDIIITSADINTTNADLTVNMTQDTTASKAISAFAPMTAFSVTRVG